MLQSRKLSVEIFVDLHEHSDRYTYFLAQETYFNKEAAMQCKNCYSNSSVQKDVRLVPL